MTTATLHHSTCPQTSSSRTDRSVASPIRDYLKALVARVVHPAYDQFQGWRQTQALSNLNAHLLRDMGAPDWLHQRAQTRRSLDCRERYQALARMRY